MKLSRIFVPFKLMLEAVTQLFNAQANRAPQAELIPVRVKETDRFSMLRSREAERRYNQGSN